MTDMTLMTVTGEGGALTLEVAAGQLAVGIKPLGRSFRVTLIGPVRHVYAVRVNPAQLQPGSHASGTGGAFSDPPTAPFGPP